MPKREPRKVDPRRAPMQSRSREMVDAILDGAVRAFMAPRAPVYEPEEAASSPSINRIAEIAGVSIGSLYQYFPGKTAIVAALVRRRMRQIHERLLVVIEESSDLSLDAAVSRFVDVIFEMKAEHANIDETIMREALRHSLTAEAFALDAELVDRFAAALERWKPRVRSDLPAEIAAHLLFQGLRAVMVVGAVARPELTSDARMRREVERLVVSYLRPET